MRLPLRRLGLGVLVVSSAVVTVLAACDDSPSIGGGPVLNLDSGVSVVVPPAGDAAASDAGDAASEDAGPPDDLAAFEGIWHGVGTQYSSTWTVLVDLHGGPKGGLVGVMTYPSLACGGTLVRLEDADGGADAGPLDAGPLDAGGDGGPLPSVVLREVVNSGPCVPVGDDSFTLLPNGDLFYAWRPIGGQTPAATGTLTRVAPRKASATPPVGIWSNGAPNADYTWPYLATISRLDAPGTAAGVFLRSLDATHACGGLWQRGAAAGPGVRLDEVFADQNSALCGPPLHVTVTPLADGGLDLAATTDAGTDAGALTLDRR